VVGKGVIRISVLLKEAVEDCSCILVMALSKGSIPKERETGRSSRKQP